MQLVLRYQLYDHWTQGKGVYLLHVLAMNKTREAEGEIGKELEAIEEKYKKSIDN